MDENGKTYEIHGMVTGLHGRPLRGARVVVWWQQIRERKEMAAAETSENGRYHLRYRVSENAPQPLLLIVEALSEFLDKPLFSPLTKAQPDLTVDLALEPLDQSEWATLKRSMGPLLDDLKLGDLVENGTHQDISFLASELGKSTETIMRVAVAARLETAFKLPAEAFYAFVRQHIPAALPSPLLDASQNFTLIGPLIQQIGSLIFALSAEVQKQALTSGIALDLIGSQFTGRIADWLAQLQALRSTDLLNQPYLVGNTSLAQLLTVAGLPPAKQQGFAQALSLSGQSMRNFWRTLGDGTHGLTAAEASAIERTLSIGAFVKNFVPLIQVLIQCYGAGTYKSLADLAGLSEADWVQLVNQTGAPPGINAAGAASPAQVFAAVVYTRVTRAYPTAALAGRIAAGKFIPPPQQKPLIAFFQNNASLELVKDNLPAYLKAQGDSAFVGINAEDRPAVIANARGLQRVLRVAPNVDVAQNLLSLGLKSATQIATLGQQQFFTKATSGGLSKTEANQVYQTAAQRYAGLVSLYMRFNVDSVGVWPQAIGNLSDFNQLTQQAVQRDQSLATLFGSQDYCATDDCTSVLSPAAYLCDLLLWLRNHPQGGQTALDVLSSRRPDIRRLLLNCPNTDTELPYVDLVNELLADKISAPIDAISTTFVQEALIDGTTYYYIVTAVNGVGEGAASAEVSATPVKAAAVPAAPAGVAATAGNAQVTISWNDAAGATGYNIYWSTNPGVTTANGTRIAGAANPYQQPALTNGTAYYYIVTAVNAMGEGAGSAQVTATPAVPTAVPAAPAGVAVVIGDTQITISWNAAATAAGYNIYWSTTPGVTSASGTKIPGAANPYLQAALVNGTTYYYIVTAFNAVGESAASAQVSAAPAAAIAAPAAPTGVSALPGDGEVTISWNAAGGATSYNIYWSTAPGVSTANGTEIMGSRNPRWKQTSANKTAAELRAAPEYFNQGAYLTLFSANYPFSLPYSAGLDELRTYLLQWKLPPWQLRQALLPLGGGSNAQNTAVAAERFGIPPHGVDLITNANFAAIPAAAVWNTKSPPGDLAAVPAFLQAASLTYESLLELLEVAWVQGGLHIGIVGIDDTCMTSKQVLAPFSAATTLATNMAAADLSITVASDAGFPGPNFSIAIGAEILLVTAVAGVGNTTWTVVRGQQGTVAAAAAAGTAVVPPALDLGFLDRANRFLRLWAGTGYKMWELDLLLSSAAVGNGNLDQQALIGLLAFRQLQDATLLSVAQLLAFYQSIDTATHRDPDGTTTVSQYAQVFLNPAITSVTPDPDMAALPTGGAIAHPLLTDHLPAIQAALGISGADTATLFSLTDNQLTLANLSLIYAVSTLAAAAKLKISDLVTIAQLLLPAAANATAAVTPLLKSPSATLAFLGQAKAVQQASLSLDAVTYLLTPPIATTLAAPMAAADLSITVASDAGFPAPNFYISIGPEVLLVTGASGVGNTTWKVARAQQGTTAVAALNGATVSLPGGWLTTTQMTRAGISAALAAIQQSVVTLLATSTTLASAITAAQTAITVGTDTGFPAPNFYVYIGSEILLVTAVGGAGNTTWTVVRGQQGTTAAAAPSGATVTPTTGDATGVVVAAVAANAHNPTDPPLASDVAALILQNLQVPGTGKSLLTVLMDPAFIAAAGTITVGGAPATNDVLKAVLTDNIGDSYTVSYNLTAADNGSLNQTASDFAQAINASQAVAGPQAFLAPCQVSGPVITLTPLNAGAAGSSITSTNTAAPGGANHVSVSPATTTTIGQPNFQSQFLAIQLFDKVGVLVRGVQLVLSDLTWLLNNAAAYGGLDLTQLPVAPTQPAPGLSPLLTTLLAIKLARLWKAAPPSSSLKTLYDIIGGVSAGTLGDESSAQTALATITGWPLGDITALAGALGFAFPASYEQPAAYDALRTVETMAKTANASGAQILNWGAAPPDETTAEAIAAGALGVLKAQQAGNDAWLSLAPTIMNPIRDRRSTALQAYLIGQRDGSGQFIYGDSNGLFDYFLIDTQMTSCQVTSRVVQAYIAVQIFVERCLMNLEAPQVVVDLGADDTWKQWQWMKRYRVWEANREVFLYPENWLIESQRPDRTEIYQKLEQEVRQGQSTTDYLETVVLNYIDRLDGLAHLLVTGTCEDTDGSIYVVARTLADPPVFYLRTFMNGAWSGWNQIPLNIKAHQVVPALYRGRICLFWLDVKVSNEPQQSLPVAQPSPTAPSQKAGRYVSLGVEFSIFRNGNWAPAQAAAGKLFDRPILEADWPVFIDSLGMTSVSDVKVFEQLYSIKIQAPAVSSGYGANLFVDVFRLGKYMIGAGTTPNSGWVEFQEKEAVQLGRAVFDGRFSDLELNNMDIVYNGTSTVGLLTYAQQTYGPDAQTLLPLSAPDSDLISDSGLLPEEGALESAAPDPGQGPNQSIQLNFTSAGALEQNVGALLLTAQIPLRVVGPNSDLNFIPTSYFFFQDNRRCYYVESQKFYWTGSMFSPVVPSYPGTVPYEVRYVFHLFYHPFTRLFWHQLSSGGFDSLYDPNLQSNPDQIDPSGSDQFSFQTNYGPTWRVWWDHDDVTGQDRQFLDFSRGAGFSVYNWELFYHIPLYIAQLLSQNQQFEDAQSWFHYIFNPTLQGSDPVPQRFWIPKPLHNLTGAQILSQEINVLLEAVNQGDPAAVGQVNEWRANSFNPFLLADLRLGVPYMKSTVMSYLDNLIAWADNLFSSQSREALSEATLLYVIASEILGPTPQAVTPPQHADESFDQLEPALDAFANAMVEIENVIGGAGGGTGDGGTGSIPGPQTFYFKIPPNDKLLGYWSTVADRLQKMRHCQSITGAPLELALFDAPIDPGLLIAAQAAGVDLSSVLTSIFAPLPSYRFTSLYPIALDFVNAVRAYGAELQAALEKGDAGALTLLQQSLQQQLLIDGNEILGWQVEQAENNAEAAQQALNLAQQKFLFYTTQPYMNAGEIIEAAITALNIANQGIIGGTEGMAAIAALIPQFKLGVSGFGGTPTVTGGFGGSQLHSSLASGANVLKAVAAALDRAATLAREQGAYERREDNWNEGAAEAAIQIKQAQAQLNAAGFAQLIVQQNQVLHQEQIDNLQKQIDFLNDKFTSDSLYDWMAGSLSATYFQSYRLAYQMCKQVERCYQLELGIFDSTFIQFGYWDSLHKGLLAGESLSHDLRRMQSSYLQQNTRRYEISRFIQLSTFNAAALQQLITTGTCQFKFSEQLFDHDYPGHYNRRLVRVSATVVYPNPGKFDNIKGTLTLQASQIRVSTDTSSGYAESPAGSDPRFLYDFGAVTQRIVLSLGNVQDDPCLFENQIHYQITDPRYLPFENAGAISTWQLDMDQANNETDLSKVTEVAIHFYYTALDGGATFQAQVP